MAPGYVLWLRDEAGEFPHFVFSSDIDMVTNGLVSLTAADSRELLIVRLSPEERRAGEGGPSLAAARAMATLGRQDLMLISLVAASPRVAVRGVSFQESLAKYKPPELTYSRPSTKGKAHVVREESVASFTAGGGCVHVLES